MGGRGQCPVDLSIEHHQPIHLRTDEQNVPQRLSGHILLSVPEIFKTVLLLLPAEDGT